MKGINMGGGHRWPERVPGPGSTHGKHFPWMSILLVPGRPEEAGWSEEKMGFSWMGILPGRIWWGEHPRKPRGAVWWGKYDVSHNCSTSGTRIGQGYHPIKPRGLGDHMDIPQRKVKRVKGVLPLAQWVFWKYFTIWDGYYFTLL